VGRRGSDPVLRTVLLFAGLGLLLMVLVAVAGIVVLRRVATDQAMADARDLTALSGRIVEQRLDDGVVRGVPVALAQVASVVTDAVIHDPVVGVRLWTPDGRVVYADAVASHLIGKRFPAAVLGLESLSRGDVDVRSADLSAPQNRDLRRQGTLLDSFTPVQTLGGSPLLFETLQRSSSVSQGERELLATFAPVLLVTLVVLAALFVPLAWALATRLQRAARDRARLLEQTIDVTDRERRRIAADLHDGPVQELAGLAMHLSAQAVRRDDGTDARTLRDAAEAVRSSVRTLRSAIVGIYPPDLDAGGLGQALSDLTARLPAKGLEVSLEMDDPVGYGPAVDRLLFRACQEGLRNVETHASARRVDVVVRREGGRAVLVVSDDGRGIDDEDTAKARQDGHVGLGLLRDLVNDAGGRLSVGAVDGGGTALRVEIPT
jgi:two-component system, NarL family, sensor kinase